MNEGSEAGVNIRAAMPQSETRGSVIVGLDGSEHSRNAASWAAGEAALRGTPLILADSLYLLENDSILPPPEHIVRQWRQQAQTMVEHEAQRLEALYPGLPIGMISSDLPPAPFLTGLSKGAELLVTGSRGHGGFTGMLIGSVSRKLTVHAHCPLVVVRTEPPTNPRNEVVLGVGPKPSQAAVRFAFDAAAQYGASLTVVRAWWPMAALSSLTAPGSMCVDDPYILGNSVLSDARAAAEPLKRDYPGVDVHVVATEGNTVPALVNAAHGARLLVVGGHRHRGPLSVGPGYVIEGAMAHSPTPVSVVPVR